MLQSDSLDLISQLMELRGSTTFFLESVKGSRLKVIIESQDETQIRACRVIKRVVRLYFYSSERPVLYCISYLNKEDLTPEEYMALMDEQLPIGMVFHGFNDPASIEKRNISVSEEEDPELAVLLNVQSPLIFKKQYDYWVAGRNIGSICEYFNEESISRV